MGHESGPISPNTTIHPVKYREVDQIIKSVDSLVTNIEPVLLQANRVSF